MERTAQTENESLEIRISVLRIMHRMAAEGSHEQLTPSICRRIEELISLPVAEDQMVSVVYLKYRTRESLGLKGKLTGEYRRELEALGGGFAWEMYTTTGSGDASPSMGFTFSGGRSHRSVRLTTKPSSRLGPKGTVTSMPGERTMPSGTA